MSSHTLEGRDTVWVLTHGVSSHLTRVESTLGGLGHEDDWVGHQWEVMPRHTDRHYTSELGCSGLSEKDRIPQVVEVLGHPGIQRLVL